MFTTESPVDMNFFVWAYCAVDDIHAEQRIEWVDDSAPGGSRIGTLRGFVGNPDNMARAIVRVTLDSGTEYEVNLVDLMNATRDGGYAHR